VAAKKNYNHYTFGLGTIGRDMVYTLVAVQLMFYLTDILQVPDAALWWINGIILAARIFDALNDPIMGVIVDNTRTRFGKFKPWIAFGAVTSAIFTVLMFSNMGNQGAGFIILFGVVYVFWGISYTTNDISYWSMLPALSTDWKEREKIGALARIFANIGMFAVVAGIVPITEALGNAFGKDVPRDAAMQKAYFIFALGVSVIMVAGQCVTLFGVREQKDAFKQEPHTTLKNMITVIFRNDQLLYTGVSMVLFMIGYTTTTSFGLHFFKYAYKDENMYAVFAIVLGVAQILALAVFPLFSKRFDRKTLYTWSTILVVAGYIIFFFAPMNMLYIGAAGILIFLGQAFIQLLMLMFLADSVEYGQWKLGKRNESVTFAIQPFINKMGGAIASGITGATLIISGINEAKTVDDVTAEGLFTMKMSMLVLPLFAILAGYLVYRYKYKIDSKLYQQILADLKARGDIRTDGD
jgi:sugar (glycoside-pentoside-hexuronide) transporter